MTPSDDNRRRFSRAFLLILVVAISAIFFAMIRRFLTAILLAGIFGGMTYPLYRWLLRAFRGRKALSSVTTVLIVLLLIVVPISGFLGLVASQAVQISESVGPWIERQVSQPDQLDRLFSQLPILAKLEPYQDQMMAKVGELAGRTGTLLVGLLASATKGTATFFLQLFIMLYAMFFFLIDGRSILDRILYYTPLSSEEEERMVEKFVSVARATLKGSLVIGIVQGGLAGVAFWLAGIPGAAFWGTVMAVLSIIPGVGAALVWIPAAIFLFATGRVGVGIGLSVWCAAVVGTVDNFLRPRLVGKDTKMSDLLVLLGTLGGIFLFGAIGFIIGPIVAALFVTVWDLYGEAFKDLLPPPREARALGETEGG
ncbi:MAG: AI-2E family transporter [Gemmatimonadota bacterium]